MSDVVTPEPPTRTEVVCDGCHLIANRFTVVDGECVDCRTIGRPKG
jgi:hypothetical protein